MQTPGIWTGAKKKRERERKGTEKLSSLDLGDRIHARSTIGSPKLCEKSPILWKIKIYGRTLFLLFPVSTLQAVFRNEGTDNELSTTATVPHMRRTKLCRPAFLQHPVPVTHVVILNLLVWTVPDTGRAASGFGRSWHASVYLLGVPLWD